MCEDCLDMFGLWCLKDIEDAEYLLQLEPPVEYICVRAPLICGVFWYENWCCWMECC